MHDLADMHDLVARPLGAGDADAFLSLAATNPLYFRHFPPVPTRESFLADLSALPSDVDAGHKHFVGLFLGQGGPLAAVLDLVEGYPDTRCAYLGLLMVDGRLSGRGLGRRIVEGLVHDLGATGRFDRLRLARVEGNPQSEAFWARCGLAATGERVPCDGRALVVMERSL